MIVDGESMEFFMRQSYLYALEDFKVVEFVNEWTYEQETWMEP